MKKNKIEINYTSLHNTESIRVIYRNFCFKKKIIKSKLYKIFFLLILIILFISLFIISKIHIKIFQYFSYNLKKKKNKFIQYFFKEKESNENIWKQEKLVIHSLGEYNNTAYTNSYEGLNYYHIIKKMNLIEADFLLTKDEHIICAHDYEIFKYKIPNFTEFKQSRTRGNLTPITFEDLVKFMYTYKELYIITDTKYTDILGIEKEFNEMTTILNKYIDVNKRFIIEIYNEKMYEFLKLKKYPFNHFLFTLYQRLNYPYNYTDMENIFKYCNEKHIDGIIMWDYWFNERISNFSHIYSIPVYLHTVNDIQKIIKLLNQGAKAIFTDNITNDILEKYLK